MHAALTVLLFGPRTPASEAFADRLEVLGAHVAWDGSKADYPAALTFTFSETLAGLRVRTPDGEVHDPADPDTAARLLVGAALTRGRFYSALLEAMPDGIARIGRDGTYLFVKAAGDYESVQAPHRLLGRNVFGVLPESLARQAMEAAHAALDTGTLQRFEYEVEVNGQPRRREARVVPSGPDEVLAIMRDVTEQHAAQQRVAQREQQFRALFEHSPDAIVVIQPDGLVLDANPAACRLHRIERGQLVGGHLLTLVPDALHHAVLEGLGGLVSGALPYADAVVLDTEGREIFVEIRATNFRYGDQDAILLQVRDVTARRRSEAEARQHLGLVRTIVRHAPVILFSLDAEGVITLAEGRGLDAFGRRAEGAVGTSAVERFRRLAGFGEAVAQAQAGMDVARSFRLGGRYFECRFTPDGQAGVIGVALDVTDVLRAKEQAEKLSTQLRDLTARQEEAQEAERARISREVHDVLGQSLTAIRLSAARIESALESPPPPVRASLDLLKRMVDETIQTVRRIATDLRPGILDDLGLPATLQWQARDFTERSGLPFTLDPVDQSLTFSRDQATALFRIFQEILTNIVRHAGASRVEGSLTRAGADAVLRVRDDGRGIRVEDLARTESLGLLGMRERLRPWNGQVSFDGAPGAGTTVTVRLPLEA